MYQNKTKMDIIKNRWIALTLAVIGAIGGYIYWQQVGCESGTCVIQSHWYTSTGYGLFLGYVLGDSIENALKRKRKTEKENEQI